MSDESSEREQLIAAVAEATGNDEDEFREKVDEVLERADDAEDVTEVLNEMYGEFEREG